jgi:hypothetical protein
LIAADSANQQAKQYKAQGLIKLGNMETSANRWHYYLTCTKGTAKQLVNLWQSSQPLSRRISGKT